MNEIVVGMGEALWDVLPEGKKIGGAPANFAYHVSQFGLPSCVVSAIGDDTLGKEIIENLISLSATCLLILLYPLFFYLCSLKIVGVVILGLAILSASYTTYRYYNACLLAGTIMGLITLWLNYLFIISFGFLLL